MRQRRIAQCVESKENLDTKFSFDIENRSFEIGEIFEDQGVKFEVIGNSSLITCVELSE